MVTKKSVLLALFVAILPMQNPLLAAVTVKAPDPVAWFDELLFTSASNSIQRATYVVVKKTGQQYVKVESKLSKDAFYADEVSAENADFAVSLNPNTPSEGCAASAENMRYCLGASYALDVTTSVWELYSEDAAGNSHKVLAENGSSNQDYAAWIQKNIDFDGMILASKDGFFLAQMRGTSTSNDAQALAIKGSEKKKYLGAAEKAGIGLLVILKKSGKLGTLKTVFVADSNALEVKPGTKIIIEKSKN